MTASRGRSIGGYPHCHRGKTAHESQTSAFVTNATRSLEAQLLDGVVSPVDELHAHAPFFDEEAVALAGLIRACLPRRLVLYLGDRASVDGVHLRAVLDGASADIEVVGFDPKSFVHAKLVAVVANGTARVLTGSANLSRAALASSYGEASWSNVEAGVLHTLPAIDVRSLLERAPNLRLVPYDSDEIGSLTFERTDEASRLPLELVCARILADERIEVRFRGSVPPEQRLYLACAERRAALRGLVTVSSCSLGDGSQLVWIEDENRAQLSNRVPPDHPARLQSWLREGRPSADERPRELGEAEAASPLGQMLVHLQSECILDFDDTEAARHGQRIASDAAAAASDGDGAEPDWSFVERILADEIRYDRRTPHYLSLERGGGLLSDDPVFLLLQMMAAEVPSRPQLRLALGVPARPAGGTGTPWTTDQRLQVRLFNLLERWSRALSDSRLRWINPFAPIRNYAALLAALVECNEQGYLPEPRLAELTRTLLGAFASSTKPFGYLFELDDEQRGQALAQLPTEARSLQAALVYVAVRPRVAWRQRVLAWQVTLASSLESGILGPDDAAASAVQRMVPGLEVDSTDIRDRLTWASTYIDDQRWCDQVAAELGLDGLTFVSDNVKIGFPVEVRVDGVRLGSPSLVPLIRRVLAFRRTDRVAIDLSPGWLAVALDRQVAFAEVRGERWRTIEALSDPELAILEELHEGLDQLMARTDAA